LTPNVKVEYPAVIKLLKLVNLTAMNSNNGVIYVVSGSTIGAKLSFSVNNNTISLALVAQYSSLVAGQTYVLAFEVKNPMIAQAQAPISVQVNSLNFTISTALDHDLTSVLQFVAPNRTFAGDGAALRIGTPEFVLKIIGQSNPYPDAMNTLTVTLAPNITMGTATLRSTIFNPSENSSVSNSTLVTSKITLSGLLGTQTSASIIAITQISPTSSLLKINATWLQRDGQLVVSFENSMKWRTSDASIIFSFTVKNPAACQISPDVTISATSEGTDCPRLITPALMDKDRLSRPSEKCRACGSAGECCAVCQKCDEPCE
jgi:hypothetical protein